MSKNVVLTLESRFMDEYGEYANLPVFNAHGSIVGYVGGEVPESGNPCEFNRLNDEGFTFCASATEVVRLKAENAKLRKLIRELFRDFANADYELKSRCGRTFMAVTRYLPRLQELEVEP